MSIIRIMYLSESACYTSPQVLTDMAAQASHKNAHKNITGVLIKIGNVFFQILEGEEVAVSDLIEKISTDNRHHNVRIVDKESNISRAFAQWGMGSINLDEEYSLDVKAYRLLRERIQAIIQEESDAKKAVVEIIQTLPGLLDIKSKRAA